MTDHSQLVKELTWSNVGRCAGWTADNEATHLHLARGDDRLYEVARGKFGWCVKWQGAYHAKELATIDAAKATAQADYAARVLSALKLDAIEALQARVAELEAGMRTIAHTFTEDSHGNLKSMPARYYQDTARALLERNPS